MSISLNEQNAIKNYFKTQPVVVVYFFGSIATGLENSQSDVDIAVLFDDSVKKETRFQKKLEILGVLTSILRRDDVDVVILNDSPVALKFSAIQPAKIIYEKDTYKKVLFEAKALSDYQDYSYYIRENTMNSLGSISQM